MSNKKYNEEIRRYEAEAEDRYDDYDNDNFDTGLEGHDSYDEDHYEDSYEDHYEDSYEEVEYVGGEESYDEDHYDNYNQASIGKIDPNDRTLTITISNDGSTDAEAIIFGANEGAAQPAGVTVVVQESSHNEVREESKANPFKIQGMKMSVSDPLQFDNVWSIVRRTSTGSETKRKYQPRNATSPQNTDKNLIDDSAFEMDVTGQDSIRFTQKAGAKTTLTLTIKARVDMGNVLMGHNVAEMSNAPRPTGLPQIDLMHQRLKPVFGIQPRPQRKPVVRKVVRRPLPSGQPRRRRPLRKRRPNQQ
jgi:hypothetical protein